MMFFLKKFGNYFGLSKCIVRGALVNEHQFLLAMKAGIEIVHIALQVISKSRRGINDD